MPFKFQKLSTRLFVLLSLWTIIAVAIIAVVISNSYRNTAEERLRELLNANLFSLMGVVTVDDNGKLTGSPELGDPRFSEFESGWYWVVSALGDDANAIRSTSLGGQRPQFENDAGFDDQFQRVYDEVDRNGTQLRVLEARIFLGEGDQLYSFRITGNLKSIDSEVADFTGQLITWMSILGASIVLVSYFLLRIGLRPLAEATQDLHAIRDGKAEQLSGEYPQEIQPLIDETNALIKSNTSIIERARTQVGNLAHSLKTPLAVLQNEADQKNAVEKKLLNQQVQQMRDQIQVYLDRARISARYGTVTSRTRIAPVVSQLVSVIAKLNPELNVSFANGQKSQLVFSGEEADFQEIIGNLLENAAKFATERVEVGVKDLGNRTISITIEDDGPGLDEDEIKVAMQRGKRLDESLPGSGLGLSIVSDIVTEYGGRLVLDRSGLGGLLARVELPGRIDPSSNK